jgi:hypothetical protein
MEERVESARAGRKDVPDPVGEPNKGADVKRLWNTEIDDVTTTPKPGAIELTPEEAQAFLDDKNQVLLRKSLRPQRPPKQAPEPSPNVRPSLSPPESIERAPASGPPRSARQAPTIPDKVPGVPARTTPQPSADTRRYGGKDALPGRRRPAPPPEPKAAVRQTGPGRAARAAEQERPKGLAQELRAQGTDRVYVVPRRHSAQHTETLLDAIDAQNPRNKTNADLRDLDHAVRQDRDARPMNGRPKGWSRFKNEQSKRIGEAQRVERHVVPSGDDDAAPAVVGFARGTGGTLGRTRSLRLAADRAGGTTRRELEQTRVPVLLDKLERLNAFTGKKSGESLTSIIGHAGDQVIMRGAYPVLRQLEGPLGAVGMGGAGRVAVAGDQGGERRRAAETAKSAEGAKERRQVVVDKMEKEREAKRPKKKRRKTKRKP